MPPPAVMLALAAVSTPVPLMTPTPLPLPLAVRVSAAPPEAVKPVPRVMLPLLSKVKPPVTVVGLMVPAVVWIVPVWVVDPMVSTPVVMTWVSSSAWVRPSSVTELVPRLMPRAALTVVRVMALARPALPTTPPSVPRPVMSMAMSSAVSLIVPAVPAVVTTVPAFRVSVCGAPATEPAVRLTTGLAVPEAVTFADTVKSPVAAMFTVAAPVVLVALVAALMVRVPVLLTYKSLAPALLAVPEKLLALVRIGARLLPMEVGVVVPTAVPRFTVAASTVPAPGLASVMVPDAPRLMVDAPPPETLILPPMIMLPVAALIVSRPSRTCWSITLLPLPRVTLPKGASRKTPLVRLIADKLVTLIEIGFVAPMPPVASRLSDRPDAV